MFKTKGYMKGNVITKYDDYALVHTAAGHDIAIDIEDVPRVSFFTWGIIRSGKILYARYTSSKGKTLWLHNYLMNPKPGESVDHKDRNGLNNRRCNLRIGTRSDNMANRILRSHFKGVNFHRASGKWAARITQNRKTICLGYYRDPLDAAKAYNKKAIELYGEFAVLNTID